MYMYIHTCVWELIHYRNSHDSIQYFAFDHPLLNAVGRTFIGAIGIRGPSHGLCAPNGPTTAATWPSSSRNTTNHLGMHAQMIGD